jgi:hypothetical protein
MIGKKLLLLIITPKNKPNMQWIVQKALDLQPQQEALVI